MSKKQTSTPPSVREVLSNLGGAKLVKGAQSKIYRKYLPFFHQYLQIGAKHDVDGDGKLWCKKEEWVEWLCEKISDGDGYATGRVYCSEGSVTTAHDIGTVVQRGKEYICHRLYNMRFVKNLERKKIGRNVAWFRLLGENEKPTPPRPDSIYLLKKLFKDEGEEKGLQGVGTIYVLDMDKACDQLLSKLSPRFDTEDAKIEEWQRALGVLEKQGFVRFKGGNYEYHPTGGWRSI